MTDTTLISIGTTLAIGLGIFILTCGGGWLGLCLYIVVFALIFGFGG